MHAVVRRCSGAASDGERAGAGARRDWADEAARDAQRELVAMPSTDERIGDGRMNESERQGAEGSDGLGLSLGDDGRGNDGRHTDGIRRVEQRRCRSRLEQHACTRAALAARHEQTDDSGRVVRSREREHST